MQNLTSEQQKEIVRILKTKNSEKRLMDLKGYLSTIKEQLSADFAQVAYTIWLENGGATK